MGSYELRTKETVDSEPKSILFESRTCELPTILLAIIALLRRTAIEYFLPFRLHTSRQWRKFTSKVSRTPFCRSVENENIIVALCRKYFEPYVANVRKKKWKGLLENTIVKPPIKWCTPKWELAVTICRGRRRVCWIRECTRVRYNCLITRNDDFVHRSRSIETVCEERVLRLYGAKNTQ